MGKGYVDARELLEPYASRPSVQKILDRMRPVENETIDDEVARLQGLLELIDEKPLTALLGEARRP